MADPQIKYTLAFPAPQTHYVHVTMEISNWDSDSMVLVMPVWTPGSYLVREYSRFVESFRAQSQGKQIPSSRHKKNAWLVRTEGKKSITVEYDVYANELSVRTAFIDEEHAYINGAAVFIYIDGYKNLPGTVEINPHSKWKRISVALEKTDMKNPWKRAFRDFDELVDSPFEIGNHQSFYFKAAGIMHEVAMFGEAVYDTAKLQHDLSLIAEECISIFGEHPCKSYLYIVHNLQGRGGGLEHSNSTTLQVSRNTYTTGNYNGFLSLAAHEYFHIWNVKRLRPAPLGPFDYENENYTALLYQAEGFTSYYDELLLMRAGFISRENYLSMLAGSITSIENEPGNYVQSVAEAGFDAWIKYYRSHENSGNSTISYYTKGSVIAALIDIMICHASKGEKSLDDVLASMYKKYYKQLDRGFTEEELIASIEEVCNCNMKSFFEKHINGTERLPYEEIFAKAGLKLVDRNKGSESAFLGVVVSTGNNRVTVTSVDRSGPAWDAGINVNDEIIAVNGMRAGDDFVKMIGGMKAGQKITVTVSRSGFIKTIDVTLINSPKVSFAIEKIENSGEAGKVVLDKWLED